MNESESLLPKSKNDEITAGGGEKIRISIHLEWLRIIGLSAGLIMLFVGKFVTYKFNVFPVIDGPTNSAWDIMFHGADSNFHEKDTYIYYLFNFIHTCVYIDNNPAKTCAAILIVISVSPLALHSLLGYFRINLQSGSEFDGMKSRSKAVAIFQLLAFMYFFLCLVNSPIQDPELYGTWRATRAFILHYIPYQIFQAALCVMSLNQVLFLTKVGKIPYGISVDMLKVYLYACWVMYIIYCAFLWTHIIGGPGHGLWNAATPLGHFATKFIMLGFDTLTAIIPVVCAYAETKTTKPMIIEFSMGA